MNPSQSQKEMHLYIIRREGQQGNTDGEGKAA